MCIGDSITDGVIITGSYRKFLYNGLTKKGYKIKMIGSKSGKRNKYKDKSTGETFYYDDNNSGYRAYTIKTYKRRKGIYEALKKTNCLSQKPDIVILLIGTNNVMDNLDKYKNSKDLDTLIDYILKNIPSKSILFVATIPNLDPNVDKVYSWFSNYRQSADLKTNYTDEEVEKFVKQSLEYYNSDLISKVNLRKESGQNIRVANINSVITDVKNQLMDGVHPNEVGYKLMGEYLTKIIDNYLKEEMELMGKN